MSIDTTVSEKLLIKDVLTIIEKYELLNRKTGKLFNIFEIAKIESNEVLICRVLYEILSPEGLHGQGYNYLDTFINNVLGIPIDDIELSSAKVYREYTIENNRRIDLLIETTNLKIPIEVKIYAGEQENQCFDYSKKSIGTNMYYLTRFGEQPSKFSTCGKIITDEIKVKCISFKDNILHWLENDVLKNNTLKVAPIREIIFQFIDVIRKFTNQTERTDIMEISDIILKSPENMKAAINIKKSIDEAKIKLMTKLFDMIQKKIDDKLTDNEFELLNNCYDYHNKFNNYHQSNNINDVNCPGISYMYKSNIDKENSVDIWVRIEIKDKIFVGYCCAKNKGWADGQPLQDNRIILKKLLGIEIPTTINDWWIYKEDIEPSNSNYSPIFSDYNKAYCQLINPNFMENFSMKCADKVLKLLRK